MALLTCPDCQHGVSDMAHSCPACGRPRNDSAPHLSQGSPDLAVRAEWQLNQIRGAVVFLASVTAIGLLIGVVLAFASS